MDPITIAAMLGLSAMKNASAADREKRDRMVSGIQESVSPWTGMHGQAVQSADPFGTLLQGAATGISLSQGADQAAQQKALNEALINNISAQKQMTDFGGIPAKQVSPWAYAGR